MPPRWVSSGLKKQLQRWIKLGNDALETRHVDLWDWSEHEHDMTVEPERRVTSPAPVAGGEEDATYPVDSRD